MKTEKEIRYHLYLDAQEEEILRDAIARYVDFWENTGCGPEGEEAVAQALAALEPLDELNENALETFSREQVEELITCLIDTRTELEEECFTMRRTPRRILREMIEELTALLNGEENPA